MKYKVNPFHVKQKYRLKLAWNGTHRQLLNVVALCLPEVRCDKY